MCDLSFGGRFIYLLLTYTSIFLQGKVQLKWGKNPLKFVDLIDNIRELDSLIYI